MVIAANTKPHSATKANALSLALNIVLLLSAFAFFVVMRYPVFKPVLHSAIYSFDMGSAPPRSEIVKSFVVQNLHLYPVTITGIEGSCGCTKPFLNRSLPFTLRPLETVTAKVQIETPDKPGEFMQQVTLQTADEKSDTRFRFTAHITDRPTSEKETKP